MGIVIAAVVLAGGLVAAALLFRAGGAGGGAPLAVGRRSPAWPTPSRRPSSAAGSATPS